MIALLFAAVPLTMPDESVALRFEWSPSRDPRQTLVEAGQLEHGSSGVSAYWFRRVVYTD